MSIAVITSFGQVCDSNGVPINGSVLVEAAGTTTPLAVYPNNDLTGSASNPINLSSGRHDMRYIATAAYKITVYTGPNGTGSILYTRDNIDPGVAIGSGALPVANGGTGATTPAGARTNLAAAAATDMATAQSDISNLQAWGGYNLTTRTRVAFGTTAQEPVAANAGFRFDTDTGRLRFDNGSVWGNVLVAGLFGAVDMFAGSLLQVVEATPYVANTDITTVIPYDDTIPQITEGTEILTAAITPKHASSSLICVANIPNISGSAGATQFAAAMFKSTAAGAVSAAALQNLSSGNIISMPPLRGTVVPGSVTPITISVRVGQSSAGTIRLNGSTSARLLGGVSQATLHVFEVRG